MVGLQHRALVVDGRGVAWGLVAMLSVSLGRDPGPELLVGPRHRPDIGLPGVSLSRVHPCWLLGELVRLGALGLSRIFLGCILFSYCDQS